MSRPAKRSSATRVCPSRWSSCWVNDTYSVNVLDVVYDTIDIGPAKGRPRLNLILDTDGDFMSLHENQFAIRADVKTAILRQFAAIVVGAGRGEGFDTNDALLIMDSFGGESMGRAATRFREAEKQQIVDEFRACNIWHVDGVSSFIVVFYMTEEDRRHNELNGCDDAIAQWCFDGVAEYDEFGYFNREKFGVTFDSKENLDKNFAGSLFYYFR